MNAFCDQPIQTEKEPSFRCSDEKSSVSEEEVEDAKPYLMSDEDETFNEPIILDFRLIARIKMKLSE